MVTARRLGVSLAVGWIVLPFVLCLGIPLFMVADRTAPAVVLLMLLINVPFVAGASVFVYKAFARFWRNPPRRVLVGLLLHVPVLALAAWFVAVNATPRRITPERVHANPVDPYWESAPQTAVGWPCPFLRLFDDDTPDARYPEIGPTLIDPPSLLGDLHVLAFLTYILVAPMYMFLPRAGNPSREDGSAGTGAIEF